MRVLMTGEHAWPLPRVSGGLTPKAMPSASAQRVHDWLAKGLGELGCEVSYFLSNRSDAAAPSGVTFVDRLVDDADILHTYALRGPRHDLAWAERGRPFVATCHLDPRTRGVDEVPENWIFPSRTMATMAGRTRYVINGIDPSEYIYSDASGGYLLFLAAVDLAVEKGLDIALRASARSGVPLIVAGSAQTAEAIDATARLCEEWGAEYLGDVQGDDKARLLAGARALLLPSRMNEAGPLAIAEALVSGTPVIASDRGACPELVGDDVGFICNSDDDYVEAIERLTSISRARCREYALEHFHYLRMAAGYLREYERELCRSQIRAADRLLIKS
jgi:glycosyltransferase involved in cell wall biosynthesis